MKIYKTLFWITLILLAISLAWSVYSYLVIRKSYSILGKAQRLEEINTPLEKQLVHQQLEMDSITTALQNAENELRELENYREPTNGVFFEVQVGKFKKFSIAEYKASLIEIHTETSEDMETILLGRFKSLDEAERFLSNMKELGFKSAFVIGRLNGALVDKEVAEQALEEATF